MGAYYYLVTQIPYLIYGQTPPMSSGFFRDMARPLLSVQDAALLDMVSLDPQPFEPGVPSCGSDFLDNWREWEQTLRLNLAKHRSAKVGQGGAAPAEVPSFPLDAAALASRVLSVSESPLEREIFLNKARWGAIEVFQGSDYFDRNTVYAYLLKIMLLERNASFQAETGFSEYKSLYASIMESARLSISPAGESE